MSDEDLRNLLGLLACSIRGDWNDVSSRLEAMKDICEQLGEKKWLYDLCNDESIIRDDGRYFRDCWDGPYGGENMSKKTLEELGYSRHIFPHDGYVDSSSSEEDTFSDISDDECELNSEEIIHLQKSSRPDIVPCSE